MLCSICGSKAILKYENLKGYIEGTVYSIYECSECDASFCDPLKSDSKVYEYIYAKPDSIPGYERYVRYSKLVKKVKNPLGALASAENAYWGIREALQKYFPKKENISILEVGSGLGYLTYSLNKAGYSTIGIDISKEAVEKAKQRYGNFYEAANIIEKADAYKKEFDCVIMTELIEHVEDPKIFIDAALKMLKEGGKLIITTPNKSWTPKGYLWGSDVPPIHLWWFSEKTITQLGQLYNKKVDLIDYTRFTERFHEPLWYATIDDMQSDVPKLSKEGEYIAKEKVTNLKSRFLSIKARYYLSYLRRRVKSKNVASRSSTMCAVFY